MKNRKFGVLLVLVLLVAMALFATGCGGDDADVDTPAAPTIVGTWNATHIMQDGETSELESGAISAVFNEDGTCTLTADGTDRACTWEEIDPASLGDEAAEIQADGSWTGVVNFEDGFVLYAYVLEDNSVLTLMIDEGNGYAFAR